MYFINMTYFSYLYSILNKTNGIWKQHSHILKEKLEGIHFNFTFHEQEDPRKWYPYVLKYIYI